MAFRDHFSGVAADYARYRPGYPAELFDWLAGVAPRRDVAWDCACGSGQATVPLAARFRRVVATDASLSQLRGSPRVRNAVFAAATAEAAPIAAASIDLVAVGQAVHWFDLEAFYTAVRRALTQEGVVAVWTYGPPELEDPMIGAAIRAFIKDTLGPWWPPEVVHVLDGYTSLEFPFAEIDPPPLEMTAEWTMRRLLGFIRSWSGVARYIEAVHSDPVDALAADLEPLWGEAETRRSVRWWLRMRAGRV